MYHIRSNVSILCTLKKSMRVFRNEHFVSDLVYPGEQHLMYICNIKTTQTNVFKIFVRKDV